MCKAGRRSEPSSSSVRLPVALRTYVRQGNERHQSSGNTEEKLIDAWAMSGQGKPSST